MKHRWRCVRRPRRRKEAHAIAQRFEVGVGQPLRQFQAHRIDDSGCKLAHASRAPLSFGRADPNQDGDPSDRPDIVKPGPLPQDNRNPDAAFDRTWFAAALAGRVGTSGRNQYYGPGLENYDFALAKDFTMWAKLGGQTRLQFRADFFNLLNHPNFANPVSDLSNANFGKITQTLGTASAPSISTTGGAIGGPRLIQISLRMRF